MTETVELLEAQLDTKRAYVKAAEVAVALTKARQGRLVRLGAGGAATAEELELAKAEVETAAAQLDIRKAEMRETEVRLKHAKQRLDRATAKPDGPPPPKADPARKP